MNWWLENLAGKWTIYRALLKGQKEPVMGTALICVRTWPLEGVTARSCYNTTFILTEVIDVNNLFGVITYKRQEDKCICYWICPPRLHENSETTEGWSQILNEYSLLWISLGFWLDEIHLSGRNAPYQK